MVGLRAYIGMNTKPIITARQKLDMEMTLKFRLNSCFFPIRLMSAESWTFMPSEYGAPLSTPPLEGEAG